MSPEVAPDGARWIPPYAHYPAKLVCVKCWAPWHVECGACALEDHFCLIEHPAPPPTVDWPLMLSLGASALLGAGVVGGVCYAFWWIFLR